MWESRVTQATHTHTNTLGGHRHPYSNTHIPHVKITKCLANIDKSYTLYSSLGMENYNLNIITLFIYGMVITVKLTYT